MVGSGPLGIVSSLGISRQVGFPISATRWWGLGMKDGGAFKTKHKRTVTGSIHEFELPEIEMLEFRITEVHQLLMVHVSCLMAKGGARCGRPIY